MKTDEIVALAAAHLWHSPCAPETARSVSAGEGGGLVHGPTFMANPLACAVADASIWLLLSRGCGCARSATSST